jgi:hypothetical protein
MEMEDQTREAHEGAGILDKLYELVAVDDSDGAIHYFFEFGPRDCDRILEAADVVRLDAPVLVAMLLGTRVRKDELPSRGAFAARAKERFFALLPAERVETLWARVG